MAKRLQLRRGTTAQHNTFTGANGEVTVDTDKKMLVVHDGTTAGGFPVAARANADGTVSLLKKDGTVIGVINATGLFNNTLTSTNTNQACTAAQAKILQDNKFDKTSAFGVNQSWQDMKDSRVAGTTYTNVTGKAILVHVTVGYVSGSDPTAYLLVNGLGASLGTPIVIPPSSTYVVGVNGYVITGWNEYRT